MPKQQQHDTGFTSNLERHKMGDVQRAQEEEPNNRQREEAPDRPEGHDEPARQQARGAQRAGRAGERPLQLTLVAQAQAWAVGPEAAGGAHPRRLLNAQTVAIGMARGEYSSHSTSIFWMYFSQMTR